MKKHIVLALLIIIACYASAVNKLIDYRAQLERGFTDDNTITALVKDCKGFIWIATPADIVKFDGNTYTKLDKEQLAKLFDKKNHIYQLVFQKPDILWICSSRGLYSYNTRTHQLEHIEQLAELRINSVIIENNILYLNTPRGIMQYIPENKELNILYAIKAQGGVSSMAVDMDGHCWFSVDNTLLRFPKLTSLKKILLQKEAIKVDTIKTYNATHRLLIDSLNTIWMWDKEKLISAKISINGLLKDERVQDIEITSMHLLFNNNIILCRRGQGNEILYRDKIGNIVQTQKILTSLQYDDQASTTNVFHVDELENIWIGTRNGLFMLPFGRRSKINSLTNDINTPTTLSHNTVSSIYIDESNSIWVGTAYGLNKLQNTGVSYAITRYIDNRPSINHVQDNKIEQIAVDSRGIMWLGTKHNLKFYNTNTNTYISKPNVEKLLKGNSFVRALLKDSNEKMWIGYQEGGLFVYDESKGSLEKIESKYTNQGNFTSIQEGEGNVIWVGNRVNGILRIEYDEKEQKFRVKQYPVINDSDLSVGVNCLYNDKYGNVWAGTESGLYKFSEEKDSFISMDIGDGERRRNMVSIISDSKGNLWIACTQGMYKYNISEAKSYFFPLYNGQFTRPGFVFGSSSDRKGTIFMSGINGLTYFNPDEVLPDETHYNVRFTDFRVNNKSLIANSDYLTGDLNYGGKIFLDHKTNQFSFSFSALAYSQDDSNLKHAYKLEGVDVDWVYAGASVPAISYNNLSPGEYVLKIRSTDLNGIWLNNTESLNIKIEPAFYQTWYFNFLVVILLVVLSGFGFRVWKSQMDLRSQKKMDQSKLDLYTDISHSIRTPLTLLQAPLDNLTKHYNAMSDEEVEYMLTVMSRNSNRLSLLIDQLIEFKQVSDFSAELMLVKRDFILFAKNIYDGFYDLFSKKGIDYNFYSNVKQQEVIFDSSKIETVIFNLLFNAYKVVSEGDQVFFKCSYEESLNKIDVLLQVKKRVNLRIENQEEDGFNSSMDIGIPLAEKLLKLHHSELKIDSKNNAISFSLLTEIPDVEATHSLSIYDDEGGLFSEYYINYIEGQLLEDFAVEEYLPHAALVYLADADKELANFVKNVCAPSLRIKIFSDTKSLYEEVLLDKPDLVISEVVFDGEKQGLSLCRSIKDNNKYNDISFVFLTSYTSDLDKKNGYEAGCDAYIYKPFDISFLKKRIQSLVENQENIRDKVKLELMTNPQKLEVQSSDEKFLSKSMKIIEDNMENEEFNVEIFAEAMNLSTSMLYRRIKNITNLGPNELIKSIRLKRAAQLLSMDSLRISEVAEKVGFLDVRYFSTCFKKEFGVTPSQYLKKTT